MPKNIDTSRIFTKEIKELIISLSFIYDIDAIKMTNIVKGSLNERGTINKETLRKTARNFYQFDNGGNLPTIVSNCQPEYLRKPIGDTSKRAKMIYTFETISPRELLISKNKGNEPTKRDLRLVEDLLLDYNLKPGVVNVLIDYVLNKSILYTEQEVILLLDKFINEYLPMSVIDLSHKWFEQNKKK